MNNRTIAAADQAPDIDAVLAELLEGGYGYGDPEYTDGLPPSRPPAKKDRERADARARQVDRAKALHAELGARPRKPVELAPWPAEDDPDPDLAFPSVMRHGIYPDYWTLKLGGVLPDLVEAVAAHADISPRIIFREIVRRVPRTLLTGTQKTILDALVDRAGERLQRAWPKARTLGLDCGFGEENAKRRALEYVNRLETNKWVRAIPTYDVSGETPNRVASHYALAIPAEALVSIPATAIKAISRKEIRKAVREVRS